MISRIVDSVKHNIRRYAMFVALVVIVILFQGLTGGILLKPRNVTKLIYQNSYILIMAVGMLMCILTGGNIDLSVGSVVAFTSAMSGLLSVVIGLPVWLSIIVALIAGLSAGMFQGYWIAYQNIPAFITTLAGMLVFRGINNIILQGETIGLPDTYKIISARPVPDFIGEMNLFGEGLNGVSILAGVIVVIAFVVVTLNNRRTKKSKGYDVQSVSGLTFKLVTVSLIILIAAFWLGLDDGIPIILVLLAVIIGIYVFVTNKTVIGRQLYALGGNAKAARLSGIKTKRILFLAYTNMGFLAGLAGIVYAGRLNAASPIAGQGFELDVIAACFIGGASATGGVGTVMGAIVGGFIMGILNNGMSIMGIDVFWQDIIKGLVLLFAVLFDVSSKSKSK